MTGPVVIDGREAGPGSLFVAFVGEHADGHEHAPQAAANGAVAVLGTRATELPTVVVEDPQAALQRLAAHVVAQVRRDDRLTVLAVTGSQGKTSTKDLLAAVLADAGPTVATFGSFNNELGMPLTALRVEPDTRYLVLEMGARGRGHLTELTDLVAPDVSVVLNVGSAHLGEFGSRDAIAEAKGELVTALRTGGVAVLNADDERVAAMAALTPGAGADLRDGDDADVRARRTWCWTGSAGPRFTLAAADGARRRWRCSWSARTRRRTPRRRPRPRSPSGLSLEQRGGLARPGRRRSRSGGWSSTSSPGGVVLLNDSYNANPESMRAAIDALASIGADPAVRRTVAVLGEMRELGADSEASHRELGEYAARAGRPAPRRRPGGPRHPRRRRRRRSERLRRRQRRGRRLAPRRRCGEGDAVLVKASRGARLDEVAAALQ